MQSPVYYDIDNSNPVYADLISNIEQYAKVHQLEVFLFRVPKSDLKDSSYEHDGCFMVMSPGYKIALINAFANKDEFEEYLEDVKEVMNYLFSKYEYRAELGRFNKWGEPLIMTDFTIESLQYLDKFWETLKAKNPLEKKYTELLVTLCSGSINDIERVKAGVPVTILDQVKQKIQAFDADQTRFIYAGHDEQKLIKIQGLSGTVKTELLLHNLKELYQKSEKYRIYVTCHNKILADYLKGRIPTFFNFMKVSQQIEWGERLWCTNAWGGQSNPHSGLYRYICSFYGIPFYSYNYQTSFNTVCRIAIKTIKEKYSDGNIPAALDYILVDECQDFKDEFFELCKLVTSQQVYIAGDVFQSIFAEHSGRDYKADYFLKKCYRTDPKTLMFAHALGLGLFEEKRLRWLSEEDWEACGYQYSEDLNSNQITLIREPVRRFLELGDDYESITLTGFDENNLFPKVGEKIQSILDEYPTCTVNDFCVIFLDNTQTVYSLASQLEGFVASKFGWKVNKAYESKKRIDDTLLVSNRNNVKGLEYPFVICISNKILVDYTYRNSLYTMLSRSFLKTMLFLPFKQSGISQGIIDGYKDIMKKHKMTISIPSEDEIKQIETRFTAAKKRKPILDIIKDYIATLELKAGDSEKLLRVSQSYQWEGLLEEEIHARIDVLKTYL